MGSVLGTVLLWERCGTIIVKLYSLLVNEKTALIKKAVRVVVLGGAVQHVAHHVIPVAHCTDRGAGRSISNAVEFLLLSAGRVKEAAVLHSAHAHHAIEPRIDEVSDLERAHHPKLFGVVRDELQPPALEAGPIEEVVMREPETGVGVLMCWQGRDEPDLALEHVRPRKPGDCLDAPCQGCRGVDAASLFVAASLEEGAFRDRTRQFDSERGHARTVSPQHRITPLTKLSDEIEMRGMWRRNTRTNFLVVWS